ncbi:MAG: hypothetical protein ACJAZV_002160 [Roseivirga sp.]|jgi:hypothetical protein
MGYKGSTIPLTWGITEESLVSIFSVHQKLSVEKAGSKWNCEIT